MTTFPIYEACPRELARIEANPLFITWVDDTETSSPHIKYAVVWRTPCPGIGWVRLLTHAGSCDTIANGWQTSGAFYDGADDHPEGAIEWAKTSARTHAKRVFSEYGA